MFRRLLPLRLAVIVCLVTLPPADAAGVVFPRGSRIGLEPAAGLTLSQRFPGFEDAERQVTVTLFDLPPGVYEKLSGSVFAEDKHGFVAVSRKIFPFADGLGILVSGHMQVKGMLMYRWFLIAHAFGGKVNLSIMVRVQVPEAARSVYTDAVVRKMLASVTFRPVPLKELLGMLPFQFTNMAGFRIIQVLRNGAVVLAAGPTEDLNKQVYVVVSLGRGAPRDPDLRARFARNLLSTAPIRDLTVTSSERMRIKGLPGNEVRANGTNLAGKQISVVQWLRFGMGGFLRVVAVTPRSDWDRMFNRFRTLRDGIKLR